ncbi:MAG: enolase C-terminal domain-like protein [Pseudomonadota bacterium]|jgi:L-alanine-DL-glutamate epimerase-like enolase superfamily enzyme
MFLKLQFVKKNFFLKDSFRISRESKKVIKTITIRLTQNNNSGFAECVPYKRYGENQSKVFSYLNENKSKIIKLIKENKLKKIKYLSLRNALEIALLHINIKNKFKKKFKKNYLTSITIPIVDKKKLNKKIKNFKNTSLIKAKVNKNNILETIKYINKKCPKSKIIIDANEGWNFILLKNLTKDLEKLNVIMIEQPLKYGQDHLLKKIKTKILFCADESFHINNKNKILKYYQVINVKLDKFGGLKKSFEIIKFLKKNNKKILLGCMVSSSLSIVPALTIAKYCDFLDLDGAYFLKKDFKDGVSYKNGNLILNKNFIWLNKKGPEENLQGLFKK